MRLSSITTLILLIAIIAGTSFAIPTTLTAQTIANDDPESDGTQFSPEGTDGGRGDLGSTITSEQIAADASLGGTRANAPQGSSWSISGLIIGVVGFILNVAMGMFDSTLNFLVLKMGDLLGQGGALKVVVDELWKLVRDVVNLTFIFGLVYVGFRTILNSGYDTKKMLVYIIVGALLVNFSLFIAKVVIDVSNVTAVQIYDAMQIKNRTNGLPVDLADAFMAQFGIVQLYAVPNAKDKVTSFANGRNVDGEAYLPFVIGSTIFVLVAAFVFAAGAILFIIRFGMLIFLMIFSPIAFAAQAIPGISGWAHTWWTKLFKQAFFAPAYLFMLYLTLRLADGWRTRMTNMDGIYASEFFKSGFETLAFFMVTIVLMVASLVVAQQMGAYGAAKAVSMMKTAGKASGRMLARGTAAATVGTAGALGRNTVGAVASRMAQSQRFQEWAGRSKVGEYALKATRGTASASFDARNVGKMGEKLGIGTGKGAGGFDKKVADKVAKKSAFAQTLRGRGAEAYAARQARGPLTTGGSRPGSIRTVFGTIGRNNRVVASRILHTQLGPLQTQMEALQNRESQLAEQLATLRNEQTTLQAIPNPNPQQQARLAILAGPATARGSIAFTQTALTPVQQNLTRAQAAVARIENIITAHGLTNIDPNVQITNPVTGTSRAPRADEQNF